eukprot:gene5108-915_t
MSAWNLLTQADVKPGAVPQPHRYPPFNPRRRQNCAVPRCAAAAAGAHTGLPSHNGGRPDASTFSSAVFELCLSRRSWSLVECQGTSPPSPRAYHSAACPALTTWVWAIP